MHSRLVSSSRKLRSRPPWWACRPREWSDEDIAVAVDLADVATSYVPDARKLHDQEQLSEQLQGAMESRIVIEQAKGITAQQKSVSVDQAYQLMPQGTMLFAVDDLWAERCE